MIDQVKEDSDRFIETCKWLSTFDPIYMVDYLFPCLGVIDLLTSYLRMKIDKTEENIKFIKEISSFLSVYVKKTWDACGLECELKQFGSDSCIVIRGIEVTSINIESILIGMFGNFPEEIYCDRTNKVPLSIQGDFISIFVQGVLRGAYFQNSEDVRSVFTSEFEQDLNKEISRQVAKWFELTHPKLEFSHLPELYLRCFSSTHFLASEKAPMYKEVEQFVSYFKEMNIDPGMAGRKLWEVFLKCPNEYISMLGVVLLSSLESKEIMNVDLACLKSKGYALPMLRTAYYEYNSLLSGNGDWSVQEKLSDQVDYQIQTEKFLGLVPWMILSSKYVRTKWESNPKIVTFVRFLVQGIYGSSDAVLDEMIVADPADLELRIQKVQYYFVRRDYEKGHEYCKTLLSEPGIEKYSSFFQVWGSILLELQQPELASRYLKIAYNFGDIDNITKARVANSLAWSYMLQNRRAEAQDILLETSTFNSDERISILLNLLFLSERSEGVPEILKQVINLSPCDRRVFNNLIVLGKARLSSDKLSL